MSGMGADAEARGPTGLVLDEIGDFTLRVLCEGQTEVIAVNIRADHFGVPHGPETIALLRAVLDQARAELQPCHREQISKSHMADYVLRQAATGERYPVRLRFRAVADAVHELTAACSGQKCSNLFSAIAV